TIERRKVQEEYNKEHGIIPTTVIRTMGGGFLEAEEIAPLLDKHVDVKELNQKVVHLEKEMRKAAKEWRFEEAASFRDEIQKIQKLLTFYSGSD
ncbi:MAG: UvrB/UvrC motif-containing protein, partial [Chlamydiota bacterium]